MHPGQRERSARCGRRRLVAFEAGLVFRPPGNRSRWKMEVRSSRRSRFSRVAIGVRVRSRRHHRTRRQPAVLGASVARAPYLGGRTAVTVLGSLCRRPCWICCSCRC